MNSNSLARFGAALATLAVSSFQQPAPDVMPPPGCGFYLVQPPVDTLTARYKHCGDSHVMIKWHWDTSTTSGDCVEPWGEYPFYRTDGHTVVNAYYVPVKPNLVEAHDGRLICYPFRQPEV